MRACEFGLCCSAAFFVWLWLLDVLVVLNVVETNKHAQGASMCVLGRVHFVDGFKFLRFFCILRELNCAFF